METSTLGLSCSPSSIKTSGETQVSFINRDDMEISIKLTCNNVILDEMRINDDVFTIHGNIDWFNAAGITTSIYMNMLIEASDETGRLAHTALTMVIGDNMGPIIKNIKSSIVQDERLSFAPNTYISGYSKVKIEADIAPWSSAAITGATLSYDDAVDGMQYNEGSGKYECITRRAIRGDTVFTICALDARGLSTYGTVVIKNVHTYVKPSVLVDTLYRCDKNGVEDAAGTYFKIRATAKYDTGIPNNRLTTFTVKTESEKSRASTYPIESSISAINPTGCGVDRFTITVSARDRTGETASISRVIVGSIEFINAYNELVKKYRPFNDELEYIPDVIVGFSSLMKAYYNTIDMELFLRSGLMPNVNIATTTANMEASKLTQSALSPVAVANLNICSDETASSAVLAMAKCIVRDSYQVKVEKGIYDSADHKWTGNFRITNYGDDEDTAVSSLINVTINDDMERYIKQKIDTEMAKESDDVTDIIDIFSLSEEDFAAEMKKYSMNRLVSFREACQTCLDVMEENNLGVTDSGNLAYNGTIYNHLYVPYYRKAGIIEAEIQVRQSELDIVTGRYNTDGKITRNGAQTILLAERDEIQKKLDFANFLGEDLWKEFASYRREDNLVNQNYISDGLTNTELFINAEAFIDAARREIIKSAESQHRIDGDMHNLLTMQEFQALVNDFCVGNWIHTGVDGKVYKLRLYSYVIDFDTKDFDVTFTDLQRGNDTANDVNDLLSRIRSISNTYKATARQAAISK